MDHRADLKAKPIIENENPFLLWLTIEKDDFTLKPNRNLKKKGLEGLLNMRVLYWQKKMFS